MIISMKTSILLLFLISIQSFSQPMFKTKPWNDTIQSIPGKLECEKYDLGGEGIAYHDKDSVNNGSGKLNPNDGTFYNTFRLKEGVDISYTKSGGIDNSPFNVVEPSMKQLYVGWTEVGEWINYTVTVKEDGFYEGFLMYTANADGKIAIDVDGKNWLEPVIIKSTFHEKETVAWRQWHHWNKQLIFKAQKLYKGQHVLTLKTIEKGTMNYDFIEFRKVI